MKLLIGFVLLTGVVPAVALFFIWAHPITAYRLAREAAITQGTVVAKEPQNHRSVRYRYEVGARTYEDRGRSDWPNPSFDGLSEGDRLTVFYLPDEPGVSAVSDPSTWWVHEFAVDAAVALVFGGFACVAAFALLHRLVPGDVAA